MATRNQRFSRSLAAVLLRARGKEELIIRTVTRELGNQMVKMSPVDTGRFKNNWYAQEGAVDTTTNNEADPSGGGSEARIEALAKSLDIGRVAYLTNSLPYARPLENGHSGQAPQGMVRQTVIGYTAYLRDLVQQLKENS